MLRRRAFAAFKSQEQWETPHTGDETMSISCLLSEEAKTKHPLNFDLFDYDEVFFTV